jgi:hypothetical protein
LTLALAGLADMEKSATVTVIQAVCDRVPLVPTTVTVYVPGVVELNVSVEVLVLPLVRLTLVGLRDTEGPVGETVAEMDTVPAKLSWLVTVTVEVPVAPDTATMLVGLAVKKKSGGLGGLSLANLRIVGAEVRSTKRTSTVTPGPVVLVERP